MRQLNRDASEIAKAACRSLQVSHDHGHDHHSHGHVHSPASFGKAFAIGIVLNTAFVLIESGYGIIANSMALLADAGHNLSDVLGLAVAWVAAVLANRPPSSRYTFGLKSSTILAALFNAVFLLVAVGRHRLGGNPAPVQPGGRCRQNRDRHRRNRHLDQRDHSLALCLRQQERSEYPRRLPPYGKRCRRFGRCCARGPHHPLYGLAVA